MCDPVLHPQPAAESFVPPQCRRSAPINHSTRCSAPDTQPCGSAARVSLSALLLSRCHGDASPVAPTSRRGRASPFLPDLTKALWQLHKGTQTRWEHQLPLRPVLLPAEMCPGLSRPVPCSSFEAQFSKTMELACLWAEQDAATVPCPLGDLPCWVAAPSPGFSSRSTPSSSREVGPGPAAGAEQGCHEITDFPVISLLCFRLARANFPVSIRAANLTPAARSRRRYARIERHTRAVPSDLVRPQAPQPLCCLGVLPAGGESSLAAQQQLSGTVRGSGRAGKRSQAPTQAFHPRFLPKAPRALPPPRVPAQRCGHLCHFLLPSATSEAARADLGQVCGKARRLAKRGCGAAGIGGRRRRAPSSSGGGSCQRGDVTNPARRARPRDCARHGSSF